MGTEKLKNWGSNGRSKPGHLVVIRYLNPHLQRKTRVSTFLYPAGKTIENPVQMPIFRNVLIPLIRNDHVF
jgi:hypothetical protein